MDENCGIPDVRNHLGGAPSNRGKVTVAVGRLAPPTSHVILILLAVGALALVFYDLALQVHLGS
ncbi:hypothetical protein GPNCGGLF_LOCUS545 [Methylorubrum aminovorans]